MPWSPSPCDLGERTSRVESSVLKKVWSAHYQLAWPEGKHSLHKCDEPRCANPEHVYPGTHSDNMLDRQSRLGSVGSVRPGEDHGLAKLTWEAVKEIREILTTGVSQRDLALEYGVHQSQISRIKNGKRWGDSDSVEHPA